MLTGPTGSVQPGQPFSLYNNSTEYCTVGVMQTLNPDTAPTTVFVTPFEVPQLAQVNLTPLETVMVWFDLSLETNVMIASVTGASIAVPVKGGGTASVSYKSGVWSNGNTGNAEPTLAYDHENGLTVEYIPRAPGKIQAILADIARAQNLDAGVPDWLVSCFMRFATGQSLLLVAFVLELNPVSWTRCDCKHGRCLDQWKQLRQPSRLDP